MRRRPGISKAAGDYALRRPSLIIAAKGGIVTAITAGDVLELLDAEAGAHAAATRDGAVFYRLLHQMGIFGEQAPARLREFRTPGQLTPDELIDRYQLACRPVRDLLVDYLRERQPALDYKSLKDLSYYLGKQFWQDLEHHHPGIDSLHLPREVPDAWKQRQRTKPKTITAQTGEKTVIAVERISYRQCLTPVRAFYLDLSQWAIEDPGRWGPWVSPRWSHCRNSNASARNWTAAATRCSPSSTSWTPPPGSGWNSAPSPTGSRHSARPSGLDWPPPPSSSAGCRQNCSSTG